MGGKDSAGRSGGRNAPLSPKKRGRMQENGEVSKKSPQVFAVCTDERNTRNIFFEKTTPFRNKRITFADDKTQPSLFPPQCGVHIAAIFGRYSPECQRKCSLTYCKKARRSTGGASGSSKTSVIRLKSVFFRNKIDFDGSIGVILATFQPFHYERCFVFAYSTPLPPMGIISRQKAGIGRTKNG